MIVTYKRALGGDIEDQVGTIMPDSDHKTSEWDDVRGEIIDSATREAVDRTEYYEIEDGIVFFDAENPLAWIQTTLTHSLKEVV